MPHNLTNLVQTKVLPGLYKQYVWGAQTAWMESNVAKLQGTYKGGKTMTFTEFSVQGMANYDKILGYVTGYADGAKKDYTMQVDRGRRFLIDYIDNDDTGFILSVANILKEYFAKWVIPEIDCYRISKMFSIVSTENPSGIIATDIEKETITLTLADDLTRLRDAYGEGVQFSILMSGFTRDYFGREWIHNLDYVNMNNGLVNTKVKSIDGNPLIIMPSARLKTAYNFLDGTTTGQEAGGFRAAAGAKDIKWIIVPTGGPVAVMKQDKVRVFGPDEYQPSNSWAVDHRVYHDLWMLPNDYNATLIRTGDIVSANE
ncbi:MAG: hypothetical protein BWY47_00164 [Bacteroidetes bacterium ADurb.Bin302]|nr:MAG: hypothetical protein BWY47_00164 [Bacteroidetes bacterium ADurb.Bin302]